MKFSTILLAALAASAFAFSPAVLLAQDQGAPPPPMDQGAPPPPDQQGAPPPPDQQGAPPPDQQGAPPPGQGDDSGASFDQFYNGLSSEGQWVQTPDYGYAFQPNVTDPDWAPYTDGHWVYTAYGWTWDSGEPWGWATYHYGRWVNIVDTGWCWVPGYQWAPAWVSWRWGGGYCGWAPLPPATFVGVEFGGSGVNLAFGFHFGNDCDTAYGIGPGCYNFIPIGYIGNPHYHGYYVNRNRNYVIINNTRNITNINISRGGTSAFGAVRTGGPTLAEVNAHSHTPVQEVRLDPSGRAGRSTLSGGTLSVYAPHFNPATVHQGRPATVSRTLSNVEINRGTSITHPMEVNSRFKPAAPSESAVSAAREAQAQAPKNVATSTRVAPTASAGSILQERTQSVQQRQQAETQQRTPTTENHFTGSSTQHPAGISPSEANTQAGHNAQVEREQAQEREAASQQQQQQREEAVRQQQAQQQREQAVRQEQTPSQQHESSSPFTQQQHTSSQSQQHYQQQPSQQQHYSQQGGGGNHSGGGGGNGQNKNSNGQNQGH
ncbi:MAG TPA: DUF6600 domain-containing protein [Candidatus Methylacidiphilales bacterium]|jgi:hypothetical protein|nr:DUF6600 domain-containing protein [Candidatus Methylacidiphilales bacterium]